MSIHRSLKSTNTMKRHRSVLSRLERTQILQDKGLLDLEESSILGMPKVKHLKMRIRKEKASAAASEAGAASGAAGIASAGAPAGKGAPAKAEAPAAKPKK